MDGHVLKAGDEITASRAGAEATEGFAATVHEVLEHAVVLQISGDVRYVRPGVLLTLKPKQEDAPAGFAAVDEVTEMGEKVLVKLTTVRWQNSNMARALRKQVDARAVVSYMDGDDTESKRTVGQAVNLSLTGVRVRLRSPLPANALVHIQVFLEGDEPFVAVAKVARFVVGSEAGERGYEVGLSYVRFIQGYEQMASAVQQEFEAAAAEPESEPEAIEPAA